MIDHTRVDLLQTLEALSDLYPHWRFGQLVANMAGIADTSIWDVEDEALLEAAKRHLESRREQLGTLDEAQDEAVRPT